MDEPIEEVYFNWLYSKVASVSNPTPSLTYLTLLRDLHSTEFVWLLSGDDNRAEDGLDLRREFHREIFAAFGEELPWMHEGCSVLEMLIAFARRASFQTDQPAREWFWIFLENLGLADLNDAYDGDITSVVNDVTYRLIWRQYQRDGQGGMFPLMDPPEDQRKVEIWYQFSEWLVDQDML